MQLFYIKRPLILMFIFLKSLGSPEVDKISENNTGAYKVKVKQSRYRPRGFQEVKVPRFRDNGTG